MRVTVGLTTRLRARVSVLDEMSERYIVSVNTRIREKIWIQVGVRVKELRVRRQA